MLVPSCFFFVTFGMPFVARKSTLLPEKDLTGIFFQRGNGCCVTEAKTPVYCYGLFFCFRAVVMFLVEEAQRNIFDQRCVENELWMR